MAIYFDGFDDKMLSFYSESGRVGMLAYPVANKNVKECDSKSPNFMGFVRNVQGNLVGVSTFGNTVEATGIPYTVPVLIGGGAVVLAAAGLGIVLCRSKKS